MPDRTPRPAQRRLVERGDLGAVDDNGALRRALEAVDQADQRRLAGAGAADDADDRTFRNLQVDVLERDDRAAAFPRRIDLPDALEPDADRLQRTV